MTPPVLVVTRAEAGQKLTQYLSRVLEGDVPRSALMRWIRTGQVRVDGRRAGPFDRLDAGQAVRVPPFAVLRPGAGVAATDEWGVGGGSASTVEPEGGDSGAKGSPERASAEAGASGSRCGLSERLVRAGLVAAAETGDYLVLVKPAGLPVHPGSGWTDSVQTRIAACCPPGGFTPTIAHRLDRDTSGLLLVAKTFQALTRAHEGFKAGRIVKEYLAWVRGRFDLCPVGQEVELRDLLAKVGPQGGQRMATGQGKAAWLTAWPLRVEAGRSLLRVRLGTGRTHQIRAQLASRGYPLLGDAKYGGGKGPLMLHAWRLVLDDLTVCCPPPWPGDLQPPD